MKKLMIIVSGVLFASSGSMYGWADKIINETGQDIVVARTIGVNSQQILEVKRGDNPVWARCFNPGPLCPWCITAMSVYVQESDPAYKIYSVKDLYWPADDTIGIPGNQCQNWIFWIRLRPDGSGAAEIYRIKGQTAGVSPGYETPPGEVAPVPR